MNPHRHVNLTERTLSYKKHLSRISPSQDNDWPLHGGALLRRRAVPPLGDLAHGRALPDVGDNDHERRLPLHEVRRRPRKVHGQRRAAAGK